MIDVSLYLSDTRLDDLIASYDVRDISGLTQKTDPLWARIVTYKTGSNKPYGEAQLAPHLTRISQDLHDFLIYIGQSEMVANNARAAYMFSDLGKTHQQYTDIDWLSDDRPSDAEKAFRREHTWRGVDIWMESFQNDASLNSHPHITLTTPSLMIFHHEKIDGSGQFNKKINELGLILQAACLVDAFDGDMIPRKHQKEKRSVADTLERLTGLNESKYFGAFDPKLLQRYTAYRNELEKL